MALLKCALVHHTGSMIRFTTSQLGLLPGDDADVHIVLPNGRIVPGRFHPHPQNPYIAGPDVVHYIKGLLAFGGTKEAAIDVEGGTWMLYRDGDPAAASACAAYEQGQGFITDVAAKVAIEAHAMAAATDHYRRQGYSVEDVSAFSPYDLHCSLASEQIHAEVKGTQGGFDQVMLTPNEVAFAQGHRNAMALCVMAGIEVLRGGRVRGGHLRVLQPWDIDAGELHAISYVHRVAWPPGDAAS